MSIEAKIPGMYTFRTEIYHHKTIATDPDNVKFVFAAVKHTILTRIVDEIFNNSSDNIQ